MRMSPQRLVRTGDELELKLVVSRNIFEGEVLSWRTQERMDGGVKRAKLRATSVRVAVYTIHP